MHPLEQVVSIISEFASVKTAKTLRLVFRGLPPIKRMHKFPLGLRVKSTCIPSDRCFIMKYTEMYCDVPNIEYERVYGFRTKGSSYVIFTHVSSQITDYRLPRNLVYMGFINVISCNYPGQEYAILHCPQPHVMSPSIKQSIVNYHKYRCCEMVNSDTLTDHELEAVYDLRLEGCILGVTGIALLTIYAYGIFGKN